MWLASWVKQAGTAESPPTKKYRLPSQITLATTRGVKFIRLFQKHCSITLYSQVHCSGKSCSYWVSRSRGFRSDSGPTFLTLSSGFAVKSVWFIKIRAEWLRTFLISCRSHLLHLRNSLLSFLKCTICQSRSRKHSCVAIAGTRGAFTADSDVNTSEHLLGDRYCIIPGFLTSATSGLLHVFSLLRWELRQMRREREMTLLGYI